MVSQGRYAIDAVAASSVGCKLEELDLSAMAPLSEHGRRILLAHMEKIEYEAPAMLMGLEEEDEPVYAGLGSPMATSYGEYRPAELGQATLGPLGASWR